MTRNTVRPIMNCTVKGTKAHSGPLRLNRPQVHPLDQQCSKSKRGEGEESNVTFLIVLFLHFVLPF